MYVLGIETSCDETSVAVVKDGKRILSNVVSSSLKFHEKYGGIIPEIASRMQLETIAQVADFAIKESGIKLKNIGLISVTGEPGLLGSLLVGISFAKSLSLALKIPLLGINHLYGHIYAGFLKDKQPSRPFIGLVVSGGHTSLFHVKDFDRVELLGSTVDDACGEAFDKIAKLLKLGYPGGPLIERLAKKGDPSKIKFRCSNTENPLDFSFSGIKTAVFYLTKNKRIPLKDKQNIAASFQETVIETLVQKTLKACAMKNINRLLIGGGVIANNSLRERFLRESEKKGIELHLPPIQLCMDNAAMVAGLGYRLFSKGKRSGLDLNPVLQ